MDIRTTSYQSPKETWATTLKHSILEEIFNLTIASDWDVVLNDTQRQIDPIIRDSITTMNDFAEEIFYE